MGCGGTGEEPQDRASGADGEARGRQGHHAGRATQRHTHANDNLFLGGEGQGEEKGGRLTTCGDLDEILPREHDVVVPVWRRSWRPRGGRWRTCRPSYRTQRRCVGPWGVLQPRPKACGRLPFVELTRNGCVLLSCLGEPEDRRYGEASRGGPEGVKGA